MVAYVSNLLSTLVLVGGGHQIVGGLIYFHLIYWGAVRFVEVFVVIVFIIVTNKNIIFVLQYFKAIFDP